VNNITKANMPEAWDYGLVPYSRVSPPELVSFCVLADFRLAAAWPTSLFADFRLAAYSYLLLCLQLFDRQGLEDGDLAQKVWTPDHADPADQAGDQAGDDELPQAPDQGGQGEHNPPPSPEQQEEDEPAMSTTGPIPAVPLRTRLPGASATSAPKGKRRVGDRSTAPLEAKVKKQCRLQPKKVPEQAG
jgi:hypothetical protein